MAAQAVDQRITLKNLRSMTPVIRSVCDGKTGKVIGQLMLGIYIDWGVEYQPTPFEQISYLFPERAL
jgi:hypothetical protein